MTILCIVAISVCALFGLDLYRWRKADRAMAIEEAVAREAYFRSLKNLEHVYEKQLRAATGERDLQ